MKRIQVLGVALLMGAAAALVACGGNQTNNNNQTTDSTEQMAPATDAQGQPAGEVAESACTCHEGGECTCGDSCKCGKEVASEEGAKCDKQGGCGKDCK